MASGSFDTTVKIWDLSHERIKYTLEYSLHQNPIISLASLNNNKLLASGSTDGSIRVWDVYTGKLKFNFDKLNGGHFGDVRSLIALDNNLLASASSDSTIKIWNVWTGELKFTFNNSNGGHASNVLSLVSLEKNLFASASSDSTIKLLSFTRSLAMRLTSVQVSFKYYLILFVISKNI